MLRLDQIKADVEQLSQYCIETYQQSQPKLEKALQWLDKSPTPEELRERLLPYTDSVPLALPSTDLPLNQRFIAEAHPPEGTIIIAVDGSQIYPDRHAAVLYYLIQVGGIIFRYNGQAPTPHSSAFLHFTEPELHDTNGHIISSQQIGVQRTLAEMNYLAELAEKAKTESDAGHIIALIDGPLLWAQQERGHRENSSLIRYLQALSRIQDLGGIPVGLVERPVGQYLTNLLWAAQLSPSDLDTQLTQTPLRYLNDEDVMQVFLAPGERTVWFQRLTKANISHADKGHMIWFCYLNIGTHTRYPVIARLEVPVWVAQNETWVTLLHTTLTHQAHFLDGNPYVLARAHETALVTTQDKAALDSHLQHLLWQAGLPVRVSEKARQKARLGHWRS